MDYLKDAFSKAGTALVQGNTLDVKIGAALIAVSAGYVYRSKASPNLQQFAEFAHAGSGSLGLLPLRRSFKNGWTPPPSPTLKGTQDSKGRPHAQAHPRPLICF